MRHTRPSACDIPGQARTRGLECAQIEEFYCDRKCSIATTVTKKKTRDFGRQSHTHGFLCRDTTRHHTVVRASLRTPSPIVCSRAFCRGQLCREIKILYCNINSPYPGQLYGDIELLYRDIISPCLGQLCHDIKILSRERESS